jgi:PAN-like domain
MMSNLKRATALMLALGALTPAAAQTAQPAPIEKSARIEKLKGVWVEGPGYDITYGANYDTCAQRCLGTPACVMLEYYRPEKKCNHYNAMRPQKRGGDSDVGIRRP